MDTPTGLRKNLAEYGDSEFAQFLRQAFVRASGYGDEALTRPIVGILDTGSDFNPCHGNSAALIEAAKRGVLMQGALPFVFPVMSIHESFATPTSMYLRNLMAMSVEEMIRAQPLDAVILIGGCDKTVPALLMGAASVDVPAIVLVTGPMLPGSFRGTRVGACTDCRRFWGKHRAGEMTRGDIAEVQRQLVPTVGTCGVMGTASTMALATEAMGMMVPGGACAPAVSAERQRVAEATGARAAQLAVTPIRPSEIMTRAAIENALRVVLACGGSTNALIHLTAVAGRLGIDIDLDAIDRIGSETPVLVDLKPSGAGYMDDLHKAGGLAPILRELVDDLDLGCPTVNGVTLAEQVASLPAAWQQDVVRQRNAPLHPGNGLAVLRGNLAPRGAIIKPTAASPRLLRHTGRAIVFDGIADLSARIDDPNLDVSPSDVLVLKNAGPTSGLAMPEAGYLPIPKVLARQGVTDMVRISDARMSGTAFGTVVLHVTPEASVGGPLSALQTGDRITLDVEKRQLSVDLSDAQIKARLSGFRPPDHFEARGYQRLYFQSVLQADQGCDFDFARPAMTETL